MPIDFSGVELNVRGDPVGMVKLTPTVEFSDPVYVVADTITSIQPVGPNTVITYGAHRLTVRENAQFVFRLRSEANNVVGGGAVALKRKAK